MITFDFQKRLEVLINEFNLESGSNTPDFILAEYLVDCLKVYEKIHDKNEEWYGRKLEIITHPNDSICGIGEKIINPT